MLETDPSMRAYAMVRDEIRWKASDALSFGHLANRITPVRGDVTVRGLGLDFSLRRRIARETTGIVHCAADTSFSRSMAEARLANIP